MTNIDDQITLNTLVFNSGSPDSNGTKWFSTDLEGWDSPGLRQSFGAPISRHGGVLLESMFDTRALVLRGACEAQCEADKWIAYNELQGLVNNLSVETILEVDETVPKYVSVIRGGSPRLEFVGTRVMVFELPLVAQDPLKYSSLAVDTVFPSGDTVVVGVGGTFETHPVFTSTSSGVLKVRNGTMIMDTTPNSLASGTVLDMAARTLYTGTTNHYNKITPPSVWWALQPGNNTVQNQGTGTVTMTYREAWL